MSWERATDVAPDANAFNEAEKPVDEKPVKAAVKAAAKTAANSSFGANMPLMSSAFDTAMWLTAA